jgi:thiazole synthase ThiGH ThiG subunit
MKETYGEELFPNEATINQQLEFMLLEMSQRNAFQNAIANASSPEEAADAMRRGFENGSSNALASKKHMDSYVNVGSPGANAIYAKDAKQAN